MPEPIAAITRCPTYDPGTVERALAEALSLLPALDDALSPGTRILLKVDLENARHRGSSPTAHPAVVKAAANAFAKRGGHVSIGEGGEPG